MREKSKCGISKFHKSRMNNNLGPSPKLDEMYRKTVGGYSRHPRQSLLFKSCCNVNKKGDEVLKKLMEKKAQIEKLITLKKIEHDSVLTQT